MQVLKRAGTVVFTFGLVLGATTAPGVAANGQDNGRHGVRSLAVSVGDASLAAGEQTGVVVMATRANGRVEQVVAELSSSAPGVVRVSSDGVLTAVGDGTATVTASAFRQSAVVDIVVSTAPATLAVRGLGADRFGLSSSFALVGTGFTPGSRVDVVAEPALFALQNVPVTADQDGSFAGTNPSTTGGPQLQGPGFFLSGSGGQDPQPTCTQRTTVVITATDAEGRTASTTFVC